MALISNQRRIVAVSQMCISIGVMVISVKNALINPVAVTLIFDLSPQNTSF